MENIILTPDPENFAGPAAVFTYLDMKIINGWQYFFIIITYAFTSVVMCVTYK